MRSPVGWLYLGISVICVIGVRSGVSSGNYQIIEGHNIGYPGGQIFHRVIPTIGVGNGPQVQGRRIDAPYYPEDYYDREEEERDSEESDDGSEENSREDDDEEEHREEEYYGEPHPDQQRIDEEREREREREREEEEEEEALAEENSEVNYGEELSNSRDSEEDEEEEEEINRYMYENGRQAYRNVEASPKKAPSKNSSKGNRRKSSNKKKNNSKKKKKKPTSETSPTKISSASKNDETFSNQLQNLQVKIVSDSHTQFVATPIADLILRLSISLAKPIGQGNGTATYTNVPVIGVSSSDEKIADRNNTISEIRDRVETLLQKITSVTANSRPTKVMTDQPVVEVSNTNQKTDDKEKTRDSVLPS